MTYMNDAAQNLLNYIQSDQEVLAAMSLFATDTLIAQGATRAEALAAPSEENEDTPIYDAYYAACSTFQRKLFTACAALI